MHAQNCGPIRRMTTYISVLKRARNVFETYLQLIKRTPTYLLNFSYVSVRWCTLVLYVVV